MSHSAVGCSDFKLWALGGNGWRNEQGNTNVLQNVPVPQPPFLFLYSKVSINTNFITVLKHDISESNKSLLGKVIILYKEIPKRVKFSTAKETKHR